MTSREVEWSAGWSAQIGKNIQVIRQKRKVTAEGLAQRTRELGYEVTRSTIANIESGRREVITVQQVAVIAMALGTSPVRLLYAPFEPRVEVLPSDVMTGIAASEWWSGNYRLMYSPLDGKRHDVAIEHELATHRRLFQLGRAVDQSYRALRSIRGRQPAPTTTELAQAERAVTQAATYYASIAEGLRVALDADHRSLLDELADQDLFAWPDDLLAQIAGTAPPRTGADLDSLATLLGERGAVPVKDGGRDA